MRAAKLAHYTGNSYLMQVDHEGDRVALSTSEREKTQQNYGGSLVKKGIYDDLERIKSDGKKHDSFGNDIDFDDLRSLKVDERNDNIFQVSMDSSVMHTSPTENGTRVWGKPFFVCDCKDVVLELQDRNVGPLMCNTDDHERARAYPSWNVNVVMYSKVEDFQKLLYDN